MENLDFIYDRIKMAYYKPWEPEDLEKCIALLPTLDKESLRELNHSRWMSRSNKLYPALFELLYKDELSDIVTKIKNSSTAELVSELNTTHGTFKKEKILDELYQRYDSMDDQTKKKVFKLFARRSVKP